MALSALRAKEGRKEFVFYFMKVSFETGSTDAFCIFWSNFKFDVKSIQRHPQCLKKL